MLHSHLQPPEQQTLPPIDCSSPIPWSQLREHLVHRLDCARRSLESTAITEAQTNAYRGEIRTLKSLLDLPNEAARRASVMQHLAP